MAVKGWVQLWFSLSPTYTDSPAYVYTAELYPNQGLVEQQPASKRPRGSGVITPLELKDLIQKDVTQRR